ncbi:hypothetical protein [Nocardia asiatica]|uniref:hypothetical protein n=1 Tax=Nocardia asiatica TaxID=209252 RepID=UPI0002D6D742|nr:hypothetical protein [Nocardia asiatica]
MPEFATGGPIEGPIEFEPSLCTFHAPGFAPTIPGADWFIEGRRYREVGRETTATGYTLTIEETL